MNISIASVMPAVFRWAYDQCAPIADQVAATIMAHEQSNSSWDFALSCTPIAGAVMQAVKEYKIGQELQNLGVVHSIKTEVALIDRKQQCKRYGMIAGVITILAGLVFAALGAPIFGGFLLLGGVATVGASLYTYIKNKIYLRNQSAFLGLTGNSGSQGGIK